MLIEIKELINMQYLWHKNILIVDDRSIHNCCTAKRCSFTASLKLIKTTVD